MTEQNGISDLTPEDIARPTSEKPATITEAGDSQRFTARARTLVTDKLPDRLTDGLSTVGSYATTGTDWLQEKRVDASYAWLEVKDRAKGTTTAERIAAAGTTILVFGAAVYLVTRRRSS